MSKFTKGKWEVSDEGEIRVFVNKKITLFYTIGSVDGCDNEEGQANARLIAAAPEMYNWLKAFLQVSKDGTVINTRHIKELLAWIDGEAKNE
ncbi:MAG: hypothetical protein IJQ47_10670 [Synergistaceae bacterium]|nr:hypothetical protein [Synergistaceae bacterium]